MNETRPIRQPPKVHIMNALQRPIRGTEIERLRTTAASAAGIQVQPGIPAVVSGLWLKLWLWLVHARGAGCQRRRGSYP